MADSITTFDTSNRPVLDSGDVVDWADTPIQFRFAADKGRVKRLARNCESLTFWSFAFEAGIVIQKTPFLALVDKLAPATLVACTFNGVDLVIYGPICGPHDEEGDDADNTPPRDDSAD